MDVQVDRQQHKCNFKRGQGRAAGGEVKNVFFQELVIGLQVGVVNLRCPRTYVHDPGLDTMAMH